MKVEDGWGFLCKEPSMIPCRDAWLQIIRSLCLLMPWTWLLKMNSSSQQKLTIPHRHGKVSKISPSPDFLPSLGFGLARFSYKWCVSWNIQKTRWWCVQAKPSQPLGIGVSASLFVSGDYFLVPIPLHHLDLSLTTFVHPRHLAIKLSVIISSACCFICLSRYKFLHLVFSLLLLMICLDFLHRPTFILIHRSPLENGVPKRTAIDATWRDNNVVFHGISGCNSHKQPADCQYLLESRGYHVISHLRLQRKALETGRKLNQRESKKIWGKSCLQMMQDLVWKLKHR